MNDSLSPPLAEAAPRTEVSQAALFAGAAPLASPAQSAAKRGRPPLEDPRAKLARLEAETARVRAAVHEADQRAWLIIGEAAAAEAESNPAFAATLAELLARRVRTAQAKADIAPLLMATADRKGHRP